MSIVSHKPTITRNELESVLDCLINDELTSGGSVHRFEKSLSELTGYKYSLAVNSATAAYHLALKALDVKEGDEIILPSYFHQSALNAIFLCKATPVLVDIDEHSLAASYEAYNDKINENTKAALIGHTAGVYIDSETYSKLTVPVIEDISHCLGVESQEEHPGYFGTVIVSSFSPNDMITTGNGAALFTNNSRYFSTAKEQRFSEDKVSFDYLMTDFQAAMGISQLSRLKDFIKIRREIAKHYYERIRLTQHSVLFPFNESFVYQSFPIVFDASSDTIPKYYKKNGIELYRPITFPIHTILGMKMMDFPNSDRMTKKMYSLPIYPTLTGKEIEKIGRVTAKFI
jgi:perosamine synthetase